jgi:YVTN family beta-propeller protein
MFIKAAIICAAVFSIIFTCIMAAPAVSGQSTPSVDNIYVTNAASDSVQVLNSNSGSVVATISGMGSHPDSIVLSPDGSKAYVAVTDPGSGASSVVFIDLSSNSIVKSVSIPGAISEINIKSDGKTLYVLAYGNIMYVDTTSGKIYDTWELPSAYSRFSVNPDGNQLYFCDQSFGMIDLDSSGGTVTGLGGWHGSDNAINKDGSMIYLCDKQNGTVIITNTDLGIDATKVSTAGYGNPERIILSPDGSKVYVLTDSNKVVSINLQSNAIVNSWDLGSRQASAMANSPDGHRLYVSCADSASSRGDIAVINMDDNSISDIFTSAGINGIAARQVAAAVTAAPAATATATPVPTTTASPTIMPTSTPLASMGTASPQASATQTVSPSAFGKNGDICPLIPISFAGFILLGLAGRRKK